MIIKQGTYKDFFSPLALIGAEIIGGGAIKVLLRVNNYNIKIFVKHFTKVKLLLIVDISKKMDVEYEWIL